MCPTSHESQQVQCLWKQLTSTANSCGLDPKEAFSILDRDGDGGIGPSDLDSFFATCIGYRLNDQELQSMIQLADLDGNGAVDYQEFENLCRSGTGAEPVVSRGMNTLREVFQMMDQNEDGMVCQDDLKNFMKKTGQNLSDDDLQVMIETACGLPSSSVGFDDFVKLMTC